MRSLRFAFLSALVSLAAACGENAPAKNAGPLPPNSATPAELSADAGTAGPATTPTTALAPAVSRSDAGARGASCAVDHATLHEPLTLATQCLDGVAPTAADLRITLEPQAPSVAPNGTIALKLRVVNVSDHTLSVRTTAPLNEDLVVTNAKNVKIAPPEGAPQVMFNVKCAGMTCSHMEVERGVVVALLPAGVIEDVIGWRASRVAWPPPALERCCNTSPISPIEKGPLAPGTYHVVAALRMWSEPAKIAPSAGADVVVR